MTGLREMRKKGLHDRNEPRNDVSGVRQEIPYAESPTPEYRGWWTAEPGLVRVAARVADTVHRLRAIGNGQVPLCAAAAWIALGGSVDF